MRRLHESYYLACICGLQFIEGRILETIFKSQNFILNVELQTIYRLRMLDISMMIVFYT
jgi:hypothetical protein